MARQITDIGIKALRPKAMRYEKPAGHGLYVIVQPSGHKSFALRYRYAGKPRKLTLKAGISLAAARREAADALYQVERGIDPGIAKAHQRQAQRLAAADTFGAVAAEYLKREGDGLRSGARRRRDLERLLLPMLGERPIGDIRRSEIIRLLDQIEEANGAVMADAALAIVRKLMNWHASRSDDFRSPIVRGMARSKPHERARTHILSDDELRRVWAVAAERADPFAALIQFLLLTAARRDEAARMSWNEIDGTDWVLPAARNKTKLDLARPLSAAAFAALAKLPRIAGCEYVFAVSGRTPIGGLSRRKAKFDAACGITGWTLHDLRRTARSLMSRAGVNADHAERCLGHVIAGVRGTYDRHEYYAEKQRAFEALANQIDRIVDPQDNVVAMREATDAR